MVNLSDAKVAKPGLAAFAIVGALTSGIGIVATIVRTKVLARVVGPEGIGISAEVSQLVSLAMTVATVASGPALLARIAEADRDGDPERLRHTVRAAIGLGGLLALAAFIVSVGVAPVALPRATAYPARLFVALAAAASGVSVLTGVTQTLFVGTSNLRAIATTTLVPTLLATGAAVALTITFALRGQFYAIAIGAFISFAASVLYLRMGPGWARVSLVPALDLAFAKDALVLGATGLIAGYFGQIMFTVIREALETAGGSLDGARFNGNYQAASAIGNTYFSLMLGSLGTYFMPRFAAARTAEELAGHVREAERFALRTAPPIVFAAVAFRGDVIHALYSDRFDSAIAILGYQLAGDVARGVSWASAAPLLVRRKIRAFLLLEGIAVGLSIALNLLLIPRVGPVGTGIAYLLTYAVYAVVAPVVLRSACDVSIGYRSVMAALGLTATAIAIEGLTRWIPIIRFAVLPVATIWVARSGALAAALRRVRKMVTQVK